MSHQVVGADIFALAERFRAQLLNGERGAATQMVKAYGRAYQRLQGDIDALSRAMAELGTPTWGQVERLSLYRSLEAQIKAEIGRYAAYAEGVIANQAQLAAEWALAQSEQLILFGLGGPARATVAGALMRLVPEQVMSMIAFLQRDSTLYTGLRMLGDDVAKHTADLLREGIALGNNPRMTARLIRRATGQGLTWSLRTARTANLYAYGEATHANYLANSHVVKQWVWTAHLGDGRVCMSCINKHGSLHAVSERLKDHWNGQCMAVPKTVSFKELGLNVADSGVNVQRGRDWFAQQSAATQRQLMGASMYAAWKDNQFSFDDLSVATDDPVYGEMWAAPSLKGLLGANARQYYRGGARA